MTVRELIKQLQKIENDGHGDDYVMISDFAKTDNPVPQLLFNVRHRVNCKKVFLESEYRPD